MRRPTLASLVLSLLALFFGWETRQALQAVPGGPDNAATATTGAWQPGLPTPEPQPSADPTPAAAAVTARPLFRPDRQPFRELAVSPVPVRNYEAELSRFTLLGVLGFGEEPVGVVAGKTGNRTDRWELKAGDALPGFTVKEVRMEGLRLTSDGMEFLLPLYAGAPTAAGGSVRTEATRRNTAHQAPVPAVPSRPMRSIPAPPAPGILPAPLPSGTAPAVAPRYIPGRR